MEISASSNSKIILIGEHSVVYGQPAIALPLKNIQTKVHIKSSQEPGILFKSRYYTGNVDQMTANLLGIKTLILKTIDELNGNPSNLTITVDSNIPAERGMGSSASTAVALVRGIFSFYQKPLSHTKLLKQVAISEKIIHGSPSGLDSATASSSVPILFKKGTTLETIEMNLDAYLVIADTGIKGKTGTAVQLVHDKVISDAHNEKLIEDLGDLAQQAIKNLSLNRVVELGQIMDQAHAILKELGVSHPTVEHLIETAQQNNALGAKLTGGGLGGCVIVLVKDHQTAESMSNALTDAGATSTWIEKL